MQGSNSGGKKVPGNSCFPEKSHLLICPLKGDSSFQNLGTQSPQLIGKDSSLAGPVLTKSVILSSLGP